MTKKHVALLEGNVKGDFSYELAPLTLVVGKNASGKSRIVDGLSLALLGEARSDGLGKREVDLLELAPEGAGELRVRATMSNGEESIWACEGTTAKASRAVRSGGSATLICDEAYALLRSDPKKLRAALLRHIGGSVSKEEIVGAIPPALVEYLGPISDVDVDGLLDVVSKLDKKLREARAGAKRAEELVTQHETVEALTDEEIAELNALVAASARRGTSEEEILRMKEEKEATEKARFNRVSEITNLEKTINQEGIASILSQQSLLKTLKAAQDAIAERAKNLGKSEFNCPICKNKVSVSELQDVRNELEGVLNGLEKQAATHTQLARRLEQARFDLQISDNRLSRLRDILASVTLSVAFDAERLQELREREAAVLSYHESKQLIVRHRKEEANLDALKKVLQVLVSQKLDEKVHGLAKRINEALPSGMRVEIALRDGSRQICRVALATSKKAKARDFRALSGAEKSILVTAFASALYTNGAVEGAKLIVIDDVWFDLETMRSLMEAIGNSVRSDDGPSQAILCAVNWPGRAQLPDGWQLLKID